MSLLSSNRRSYWRRFAPLALGLMMVAEADVVLHLPADLSAPRRELVTKALGFLKGHPDVPYLHGGADAKGMDCSGAVVSLLQLVKVELPRSSHGQYEWLKKSGRLTPVPSAVESAADPVFRTLQPGDLVFWAKGTPGPPKEFRISHVHMYLGKEADGHPVMIGSSDGRSYRGKKISGFGIVDYRVPKSGAATRIVGFGSPLPSTSAPSPEQGKSPPSRPSPTKP